LAAESKVVAVGECGLDFYYNHSPHDAQERALRRQIELALRHDLAMVFHVRDAFREFWPIFDEYAGIRGVIHSFSSNPEDVEQIIKRGLYIGLNGIMTFSKSDEQLLAAKAVPLDRLVLETDAPYLTPNPYRGTICEPKHVRVTAEFLAALRGETLQPLAKVTTANAQNLFRLR
jgi:TatD DNase family protein